MAADRKPFALRAVLLLASAVLLANARVIEEKFGASVHDLIEHITTAKESVNTGFEWLEPLVDDFGNRMLCTDRLEKAIDYMFKGLQADGFDNTHTEEVADLPNWQRGDDRVWLVEPRRQLLNILGDRRHRPVERTAEGGRSERVRQVENVDVKGKIVIYNQPWNNYFDDYLYDDQARRPTPPGRLVDRNKTLKINMDIRSKNVGTCTSKNIVFDIKGSEFPNEIVLLSGHSDTWDLGQGALGRWVTLPEDDLNALFAADGGGMAAVWQGMKALQRLAKKDKRFQPKRTIRAVFWTAEEPGFHGANAYYAAHKNTSEEFVFVSETDQGAFRPTSNESMFRFQGNATHRARLQEIVELLQANGIPLSIQEGAQGDVQPWADDGVPSINYVADRGIDFYFYFHHTQGDYLNVFKEGDIDYTAAILATLGHVLAGQDSWF
ncbi:Carboxypeptidase Q [Aphelenchoides fujianensis]|nr:Carboxypeptidase Q [Aphelenchoides fujianensis]